MDATLKAKWIAALRSGKFKQGRGQLRKGNEYCCLGVLCKVARIPISASGESAGKSGYKLIDRRISSKASETLWRMNDHQMASFSQIADYIEANL